jgi:hypothetical protein
MRKNQQITNYSFSLLIMYGAWQSEKATHNATRYHTPIHNILSTAPQLNISQKALGKLPEDGNVVPKHVEATIINKLNE